MALIGFTKEAHDLLPYPHSGGCDMCRATKKCNYCGGGLDDEGVHCTNGRCGKCHQKICTPGGSTSPGHAYGKQGNQP